MTSDNPTYRTFEEWLATINSTGNVAVSARAAFEAGFALADAMGAREAKRLTAALDGAVIWNMSKNRIIEKLEDELRRREVKNSG